MGHAHLMLNHFPITGLFFAAALLAYGFGRKSDEVKLASLWAFIVIALLGLGVFFTGESAEKMVESISGVTEGPIHRHENAAGVALVLIELLGILSVAGIYYHWKNRALHVGLMKGLLVLSIIAIVFVGRASNLGGLIRHSELRPTFKTGQFSGGEGVETPEEEDSEEGMPEPANR